MLKYLKIPDVKFDSFQERHNLYLLSQKKEGNSFFNVARHVETEVACVKFTDKPFDSGREKIEFIKGFIEKSKPCLISLLKDNGSCCHAVPVVEIDDQYMTVLYWTGKDTVEKQKRRYKLVDLERIHDKNLKSRMGVDILFVIALD